MPAPTQSSPLCSRTPCHTSQAPPISARAARANSRMDRMIVMGVWQHTGGCCGTSGWAGSCAVSVPALGADDQERDGAVGAGAVGEAVAAGVDDLGERRPDRGQVGDLRVDLGDLVD